MKSNKGTEYKQRRFVKGTVAHASKLSATASVLFFQGLSATAPSFAFKKMIDYVGQQQYNEYNKSLFASVRYRRNG